MPTFQRAPEEVAEMAAELLTKHECYQPILDRRVKIDYVFAYASTDKDGVPTGDALRCKGMKALGVCRKMPLKDRAMGRGDVEISLDADWWEKTSEDEKLAVLDHELYHIVPEIEDDDLGRPKVHLRKHDVEVGWFAAIAARHTFSQERIQARHFMDNYGQFFFDGFEAKP